MRMNDSWFRNISTTLSMVIAPRAVRGLWLVAAVGVLACATTPKPVLEPPPGPPLPFTAGSYDCAAPATWRKTSFAALIPPVQRALAKENPQDALGALLDRYYDEEVTCVAGYIHDESVKQRDTATDKDLPAQRVTATQTWIDAQAQRGLTVTNYGGEAH